MNLSAFCVPLERKGKTCVKSEGKKAQILVAV